MKLKFNLTVWILVSMGLGALAGLVLKERVQHIAFIGELFIKVLKMVIVPLVLASIIMGIVSVGNIGKLGRLGAKTFAYYLSTTFLAVIVGLVLVNIVRPGDGFPINEEAKKDLSEVAQTTPIDIVTNIVPDNLIAAMAKADMLSLIFFALLFGAVLTTLGEKAKGLINFFDALNQAMMKLVEWIMYVAPIGIFALIAQLFGSPDIGKKITSLGAYMGTVVGGLLFHAVVTLPLLLWLFGRCSPWTFFRKMGAALTTAFSTASSSATLPVTMECLEEKVGVSNRTASFVLPLGATINMDGTALYESVAALFIAQMYGVDLTFGQQVVVILTATLASIGAAAIPSAGLFTMVIVLEAVGFQTEQIAVGIGMIWGVDRILDMCRTAVNVWGDSCGAAVVARLEGETLKT